MMQENTSNNLLTDFCSGRTVALVAVIMVLLAIGILLVPGRNIADGWVDLGIMALLLQWMGLLSLAVLCLATPLLRRMSLTANAIVTFSLIQLVTLLVSEAVYQIIQYKSVLTGLVSDDHAVFLMRNLAISVIISGVALRYMYVQRQLQIQIQAENEARIQALQARIRPHFLFNSMNTIAALTHIDAYAAEKAILDLSEIFRVTLKSDDTMTTISEEIALARHYLEVEMLRLNERLRINWQIDDEVLDVPMPRLTLQPLVENAVYHGIEPRPGGGEIGIRVRKNKKAVIEISNPLSSKDDDTLRQGNRMAIRNISDRLHITYGQQASLVSSQEEDHYKVVLELPLKGPDIGGVQ